MNKESGGVVLAVLGFVALTLAFKGTWTNVWDALTGKSGSSSTATTAAPANSAGTGGFYGPPAPGSSPAGTPGSSPASQGTPNPSVVNVPNNGGV